MIRLLAFLFAYVLTLVTCSLSPGSLDGAPFEKRPPSRSIGPSDQSATTGAAPRFFLLTMAPGREVYSAWGHTAMRMDDPRSGRSFVFDYGLFRFDRWFLFRFLKGDPLYILGVTTWQKTHEKYLRRGRAIYGQELFLPDAQARAFAATLVHNAQPKNRSYVYNHFTNNCTTAYRDHLDRLSNGEFSKLLGNNSSGRSLRQVTTDPLRGRPLLWLGVNLILNADTDKPASTWQEMFSPPALLKHVDSWRNAKPEGSTTFRIGKVERLAVPLRPATPPDPLIWYAVALVWVLLLIGSAAWPGVRTRQNLYRTVWWSWSVIAGTVGVILFALNFFSAFEVFHRNWNLFAFHPLLLIWPLLDFAVGRKWGRRAAHRLHLLLIAWTLLGIVALATGWSHQYSGPFLSVALGVQVALLMARARLVHTGDSIAQR